MLNLCSRIVIVTLIQLCASVSLYYSNGTVIHGTENVIF